MIVVDSSVWIDFLNGNATPEADRLSSLLGGHGLLTADRDFAPLAQHLGLTFA